MGACVFLRGFRAAHFLFRRVKMGFAENFKSARIKNGLTQKQIAEKLNIDRSSIAHYESGDSVPSTKNIQKICDMLNLSFEELFR
ncbi:MAG: helix-turn-helix transcriptional regulator [Oscillospiraceae bacterium]|nr:helix-turn-helix transcriptional regulator [Oscillospiraceae bacterium]